MGTFSFPHHPLPCPILCLNQWGNTDIARLLQNRIYPRFQKFPKLRALQIQFVYNYPVNRPVCYGGVALNEIVDLISHHPEEMKRLRYIGVLAECYQVVEELVPVGRPRTGEVEGNVVTRARPAVRDDNNPALGGEFSSWYRALPETLDSRWGLDGGGYNAHGGQQEQQHWVPAPRGDGDGVNNDGSTPGVATPPDTAVHGQGGTDNQPNQPDHYPQQQQQGDDAGHQQQEEQQGGHGGNNDDVPCSHAGTSSAYNLTRKPSVRWDTMYRLKPIQPCDKPVVFKLWDGELD